VTDARAAGNAIQSAGDAFGRLDLLVNITRATQRKFDRGYGSRGLSRTDRDQLLRGGKVTRAALPVFRTQRDGTSSKFLLSVDGAPTPVSRLTEARSGQSEDSLRCWRRRLGLWHQGDSRRTRRYTHRFLGIVDACGCGSADYQKTVGAMIEAQSGNADIMRRRSGEGCAGHFADSLGKTPTSPSATRIGCRVPRPLSPQRSAQKKMHSGRNSASLTDSMAWPIFPRQPIAQMLSEKS